MRIRQTITAMGLCGLVLAPVHFAAGTTIPGTQDLALNQPVTFNSQYGGYEASHAVDGSPTTEWEAPITADGYITVDLGQVYRLNAVNLTNASILGRWTYDYNVQVSTTGAFTGEQGTLTTGTMTSGQFVDVAMPDFNNPANNQALVGRYIRFNAVTDGFAHGAMYSGVGLNELAVSGVGDQGVTALATTAVNSTTLSAKAFDHTVYLTDTAPASYSVRLITPTSSSSLVSVGKPVTTSLIDFGNPATITDGIDTPPFYTTGSDGEVLFHYGGLPDGTQGWATVDLGAEMLVNRVDALNTTYNGNATKDFLILVSDDPNFASGVSEQVVSSDFTTAGEQDSFTLSQPALGRYVRFVSLDYLSSGAPRGGLDELSVYASSISSQDIGDGSVQIGDSSSFGDLPLTASLPVGQNLVQLTVTLGDGSTMSEFESVDVLAPEPTSLALLGVGVLGLVTRRATGRDRS